MHEERRKSATVHLVAAVLLTCCFVQTTDCYRLKKTEKQHQDDAATRIDVQEGTIVFGKAFQIGSDLESYIADGTRRASSNDSVEDETSYQSDDWGIKQPIYHISPKEAEFKSYFPDLRCLKDHMKFRFVGPPSAHLFLDRGKAPTIPLTHIPSSCGYKVQKNSVALVVQAPYHGCNVYKKDDHFVLPLRWDGYPVTLVCPKPAYSTPAQHYNIPAHPAIHHNLKFPPYYFFPPYPKYPVLPEHPHKPELPKYPLYHHLPPYYYYVPHSTKPQVHHIPVLPHYPPLSHPHLYYTSHDHTHHAPHDLIHYTPHDHKHPSKDDHGQFVKFPHH